MALVPVATAAPLATAALAGAAEISAKVGDLDGAFALIERLLGVPAGRQVSVALLGVDPT
jgi:hypothetical protein